MPVILYKDYQIQGDYTEEQKEILSQLIEQFRLLVADDDPEKNILNGKMQQYSDQKIIQLLNMAMNDINSGYPKTNYDIFTFVKKFDDDLIVHGALIFALISEGLLQLKNQIDFSDSGLSIAMFNKTGAYQSWYGILLQQYIQDKMEIKRAIIPKSFGAGFIGIGTEFDYNGWW